MIVVAAAVKVAVVAVVLAVVFAIEAAVVKTMVVGRRAERTDSRAWEIGQRSQAWVRA